MSTTNIEWCDRVWNPVTGCTKVSQGCKNCYAEGVAKRFFGKQYPQALALTGKNINTVTADAHDELLAQGLTRDRRFTDVWTHSDRLLEPLKWRKPARIFVNSMSDLFHDDVPNDYIDRVFAVMSLAKKHTFLILTKRPARMREYMNTPGRQERIDSVIWSTLGTPRGSKIHHGGAWRCEWPLSNVHLGVSVENQQTADERIPQLLLTPAAIRWVSYEPALGPVDFMPWLRRGSQCDCGIHRGTSDGCEPKRQTIRCNAGLLRLNWGVVGGESGRGARPFDVQWAFDFITQFGATNRPAFVKQLGARPLVPAARHTHWDYRFAKRAEDKRFTYFDETRWRLRLASKKGGDPAEWPPVLRVRQLPEARA